VFPFLITAYLLGLFRMVFGLSHIMVFIAPPLERALLSTTIRFHILTLPLYTDCLGKLPVKVFEGLFSATAWSAFWGNLEEDSERWYPASLFFFFLKKIRLILLFTFVCTIIYFLPLFYVFFLLHSL